MKKLEWQYSNSNQAEGVALAEYLNSLDTYERTNSLTKRLNCNFKFSSLLVKVGDRSCDIAQFLLRNTKKPKEERETFTFEEAMFLIQVFYAGVESEPNAYKSIIYFNMQVMENFLFNGNIETNLELAMLEHICRYCVDIRNKKDYKLSSKPYSLLKYYFLSNSYVLEENEYKKEHIQKFCKENPSFSDQLIKDIFKNSYKSVGAGKSILKLYSAGIISETNEQLAKTIISNYKESNWSPDNLELFKFVLEKNFKLPEYKLLEEIPSIPLHNYKKSLYVMPPAQDLHAYNLLPIKVIKNMPDNAVIDKKSLFQHIITTMNKDIVLNAPVTKSFGHSDNSLDDYLIQHKLKPSKRLKKLIWQTIDKRTYIDLSILKTLPLLAHLENSDVICNLLESNHYIAFLGNSIRRDDLPAIKNIPHGVLTKILKSIEYEKEEGMYSQFLLPDALYQYGLILKKNQPNLIEVIHRESNSVKTFHDVVSREYRKISIPFVEFNLASKYPFLSILAKAEVNDYTVKIVQNSHQLIDWGTSLNNCLASYSNQVATQRSLILGLFKDDVLTYSVELDARGGIRQFEAKNRTRPVDFDKTYMALKNKIEKQAKIDLLLEQFNHLTKAEKEHFVEEIKKQFN